MVGIPDFITHADFGNNRLRGLGVRGWNFAIPIHFCRRSYNTISLLCDREIREAVMQIAKSDRQK